ncbi:spore cortex biosynthesis protein YabQ [Bacillus aerolatus]|uniref:Spore cortex biosynthesis protein YabQ n=1 Tax=Bacillus aerolatus TaxID=2653354 RepID=A0A6I1FG17_9BACI|nr:spore cortex biosynthesis protein YabQ [Bacillus aerolatus]KAB7704301.1 spore cortex biosynthesis protein YabQ [Bacillus aerolatus]
MSLSVQFETMAAMVAMGLLFGMLLDTYQRFLKRPNRSRVLSFFTDIMFWCTFGMLIFYCLYRINFGEIRLYIFLALLCGFSAYQALFKYLYLRLLERIILIIVNIFLFLKKCVYFLLILPVTILIKTVLSIISFIGKILMFLAKTSLHLLLFIGKVIFSPVIFIWRLFPSRIQKKAASLNKKLAGFFLFIKNKTINTANRWKK